MPRPRILLDDDDRRVRQLVGLTLPADDYELTFAEDGSDAFRIAQQTHPDLILLDYAMPGLHGVDVCAAIRSDSSMSGTPVIMLTGHGDEDTRQRAILAGANGFLTKPFSPIVLEQTIRSLLGSSNLPPLSPSEIRSVPARSASAVVPQPVAPVSVIQMRPPAAAMLSSSPARAVTASPLDAITTGRPYRPTRTWEQARVEILQARGSHFDPSVVDAFLKIFDDLQGLTGAEQPFERP